LDRHGKTVWKSDLATRWGVCQSPAMHEGAFERRGIVEGFFGPPWSAAHRASMFEFGAARGMNTYLYAPKDDPYHRERWREPYPEKEWRDLIDLLKRASRHKIDFVYGIHPGKGLRFSDEESLESLFAKVARFHDAGVRTFAVLFDDIPSLLEHEEDRVRFGNSLARAQGSWLRFILDRQPAAWRDVDWWICPSRYSEDPRLERSFGRFEPDFAVVLARYLPEEVACLWTGPTVVSKTITLRDARAWRESIPHRVVLWDNYPVNDLGMSHELHLGPLKGRDPRLPEAVSGYLNNPLLQESLSFIPLATCFDYAYAPARYDPEKSWSRVIAERFGGETLPHWRAVRRFCEQSTEQRKSLSRAQRKRLHEALVYFQGNPAAAWRLEIQPWLECIGEAVGETFGPRGEKIDS
jgi:hyaluronoglucosaminidase